MNNAKEMILYKMIKNFKFVVYNVKVKIEFKIILNANVYKDIMNKMDKTVTVYVLI